jgi:hypothetical protein
LLNNTVLHIDETGARVNVRNMFFKNYSDEKRVLYTANQTKGRKAIVDDDVLPQFVGILVHYNLPINSDQKIGVAKVGQTKMYEEKLYSEVQSRSSA